MSSARVQGYAAILVVPIAMLIVSDKYASAYGGFDYLRFVVGGFPASLGLIASVVALEVGLARGHGRDAIKSSIAIGGMFMLVNLVLMLAVLHWLGLI